MLGNRTDALQQPRTRAPLEAVELQTAACSEELRLILTEERRPWRELGGHDIWANSTQIHQIPEVCPQQGRPDAPRDLTNVNESTAADSTLSRFALWDPTAVRLPVPSSPCLRLASRCSRQERDGGRAALTIPTKRFCAGQASRRPTETHGGGQYVKRGARKR